METRANHVLIGLFTLITIAGLALVAGVFNTRLRLKRADHARVAAQLAARSRGQSP